MARQWEVSETALKQATALTGEEGDPAAAKRRRLPGTKIRLNPAGRLRFAGSDVERLIGSATADPAAVERDAVARRAVVRASGGETGSPSHEEVIAHSGSTTAARPNPTRGRARASAAARSEDATRVKTHHGATTPPSDIRRRAGA